ncbi:MAG: nucleotidyltransferase domain-containing protein [Desulfurococcaceae archaeon]
MEHSETLHHAWAPLLGLPKKSRGLSALLAKPSEQWEELLVEEAERGAEAFENPPEYLEAVARTAKELDGEEEVCLLGGVAEGRHALSSDVDVLAVTSRSQGEVLARLCEGA